MKFKRLFKSFFIHILFLQKWASAESVEVVKAYAPNPKAQKVEVRVEKKEGRVEKKEGRVEKVKAKNPGTAIAVEKGRVEKVKAKNPGTAIAVEKGRVEKVKAKNPGTAIAVENGRVEKVKARNTESLQLQHAQGSSVYSEPVATNSDNYLQLTQSLKSPEDIQLVSDLNAKMKSDDPVANDQWDTFLDSVLKQSEQNRGYIPDYLRESLKEILEQPQ